MRTITSLFICCLLLFGAVGCDAGSNFENENETVSYSESESIAGSESTFIPETTEKPVETQNGTLKELVSTLISDDTYDVSRMFWSGNEKLFIWQSEKGYDSHKDRLIQYDTTGGEERLFFEWENERYSSGVFLTEDGFKVYSDHCLYVLYKNGEIMQQTEYDMSPVSASSSSVYGDNAETYRRDGTYIINLLTGPRLKLFDSSEEEYYIPWRWSPDGEYLILFRNQLQTIHDSGQKTNSYFEETEAVVVNRDGDPICKFPFEKLSYYEWLPDSHVVGMEIYNETNDIIVAIKVVDAVSGETVGNYTPPENEYAIFGIGKTDCFLLVDPIETTEIGTITECDTYIYNYRKDEKLFFGKFYFHPSRVVFSEDGRHVAILDGGNEKVMIYSY